MLSSAHGSPIFGLRNSRPATQDRQLGWISCCLNHKLVIEIKRVRDKTHASKVSDELIIDIEHYRRHQCCDRLWCAVYDPDLLIKNPAGMISDLAGNRSTPDGSVSVHMLVIPRMI